MDWLISMKILCPKLLLDMEVFMVNFFLNIFPA